MGRDNCRWSLQLPRLTKGGKERGAHRTLEHSLLCRSICKEPTKIPSCILKLVLHIILSRCSLVLLFQGTKKRIPKNNTQKTMQVPGWNQWSLLKNPIQSPAWTELAILTLLWVALRVLATPASASWPPLLFPAGAWATRIFYSKKWRLPSTESPRIYQIKLRLDCRQQKPASGTGPQKTLRLLRKPEAS